MHELYMHYVSCKGVWAKSSLVINARKEHHKRQKSTFEFWTRDKMIQELGCEELADDLIARHKTAEQSLPAGKKGQFIIKTLSSISLETFRVSFEFVKRDRFLDVEMTYYKKNPRCLLHNCSHHLFP